MNRLAIMISLLFGALLDMRAPSLALAQTEENAAAQSLDARRVTALTQGDVRVLDQILSKDLIYTHASGWRQTKAELLASIRSGELQYHGLTIHAGSVHRYGDTVIVTGDASAQVKSKGQELDVSLLFLEAYVKQDGRWQLAAWQSTRCAP